MLSPCGGIAFSILRLINHPDLNGELLGLLHFELAVNERIEFSEFKSRPSRAVPIYHSKKNVSCVVGTLF
jgi:hypothetical protein